MKRTIIYLLFIALTSAWGAEKIAFTTKVSGRVTLTTPQGQTNPLKRGTALNMDEKIVTGSDGSVVIMFIDDKSILRIQKNTTLTIRGESIGSGSSRALSKQIDMQFGKLRAQVSEQRRGEFRISTPTSVASVKGTDFWVTSDPVLGDKVQAFVVSTSKLKSTEELRTWCATQMSNYKVPDFGTFLDEPLPRNAAGKFLKRDLRDQLVASRADS